MQMTTFGCPVEPAGKRLQVPGSYPRDYDSAWGETQTFGFFKKTFFQL